MNSIVKKLFPFYKENEIILIDLHLLNSIGLHPQNIINKKSIVFLSLVMVLEFIPAIAFIIHNLDNLVNLSKCLHELLSLSSTCFIVGLFFTKRQKIVKVLEDLNSLWKECK